MVDGWADVYDDYHEEMQACGPRMCFAFLPIAASIQRGG
jgi:hypothetical protein